MSPIAGLPAEAAQSLRPALAVTLAIAVLSVMDAAIKSLGTEVPVSQIVFLRYLAGAAVALPVFLWSGPHRITRRTVQANGVRAVVMLVAAWSFFYAITRLPLVEAVTLAFTAPLFFVFIARFVLNEPVLPRALIAAVIGLVGIGLIVSGDAGGDGRGALTIAGIAAALLAALSYACGVVLLRKHSVSTAISVVVFLQALVATVVMAPFAVWVWQPLDPRVWLLFGAIGVLGTGGHLLMAWGFARAKAGRLAPLEYSGFIWAVLFGVLFFDEIPAFSTYLGAATIILACAIAMRPGMAGLSEAPLRTAGLISS